jgi:L-aspartate oxidase
MRAESDTLVIGGGIAGLFFALKAARRGMVTLLSKDRLPESNTAYAQGGIASVWSPQDSFAAHVEDTLEAGAGLCHRNVVELVVREGPDRIHDLISLGTNFSIRADTVDREDGEYDLGREGGHSHRRILHASDATGREVVRALIAAVRDQPRIQVLENHIAIDLITAPGSGQAAATCWGAYVLDQSSREIKSFVARATVLATGGAGKVYLYTSNPDIATGDGIAMACRAGAMIGNMEFFQFHPTCLYHPQAKSFLLTEALRGEGAILRLPGGDTFMKRYDARAELAPRDIVARAIDHEMKVHGYEHVYLDISHRDPEFVRTRFPNIHRRCLEFGLDMTKTPLPVVPAAHYCCGGVVTDEFARTSIPRLYACGEAAMTGLHGANRLASNSLLEAIIFADRASRDVAELLERDARQPPALPPWNSGNAVDSDESVVVTQNWDEIRRLMWNFVGIVRTNRRLERARKRIRMLQQEIHEYYWNFLVTSDLVELRNIALVAELIIESAISRRESRGLHYNRDTPERGNAHWLRDTLLNRETLERLRSASDRSPIGPVDGTGHL